MRTTRTGSRRGFTLVEMMVAVAILLAVMAMVGTIFSTAGRASGQAQPCGPATI
jgi:prepilin-type N-terminal cleavage/methylation domain-containing protein